MRSNRWNSLLTSIADAGWDFVSQRFSGRKPDILDLCADLLSNRGEASGIALARLLVERYRDLDDAEKAEFFDRLVSDFQSRPADIDAAIIDYRRDPGPLAVEALSRACESPRLKLFRRINMAPDGIAAILEMRAFVLQKVKVRPAWQSLDRDLRTLLESWFNPGFLTLQRIDWHSPADVLEKLVANEKVHAMQRLEDLRRRLAADRRCFAFFHPALPDEPLIFVQVALVRSLSDRVQPLLDDNAPILPQDQADTAIFYSISTCVEGLKGVTLGNFLIKRVVTLLKAELPEIRTFSTLSPVPGLMRWLEDAAEDHESSMIREGARKVLATIGGEPAELWLDDDGTRRLLLELTAHYLVRQKHNRLPFDPVARFHLGNGARLERINWQGDVSANGLRQSAGILVNYLYDEATIEANHEALVNTGDVVHAARVRKLLPALPKPGAQPAEEPTA